MPEANRQHRRHNNVHKKVPIAGGIVLLLVVTVGYWFYEVNRVPKINIPYPMMPTPNAFDTFASAGKLLQHEISINYAFSKFHKPGDKDDREYTSAELDKIVADNKDAFAVLEKGLSQEYLNPPMRSFGASSPYYARYRALARALGFKATVLEKRKDWEGALNSRLDAMELGAKVQHGSTLTGTLVGNACQSIGRKPMWDILEKLSAKQARAAVKRLERIESQDVSLPDTLIEEKHRLLASMNEVLIKYNLYEFASALHMDDTSDMNVPTNIMYSLTHSKSWVMNDFSAQMDKRIELSRQPYARHAPEPAETSDPIVSLLVPELARANFNKVAVTTQNRLIMIALALQSYKKEHSCYPDTLQTLVGPYITKLPDDPFALGGTFHYNKTGSSYTLYSIGPDSKDDGGKIIDSGMKSETPDYRRRVMQDSIGDIVAGKNKQ